MVCRCPRIYHAGCGSFQKVSDGIPHLLCLASRFVLFATAWTGEGGGADCSRGAWVLPGTPCGRAGHLLPTHFGDRLFWGQHTTTGWRLNCRGVRGRCASRLAGRWGVVGTSSTSSPEPHTSVSSGDTVLPSLGNCMTAGCRWIKRTARGQVDTTKHPVYHHSVMKNDTE